MFGCFVINKIGFFFSFILFIGCSIVFFVEYLNFIVFMFVVGCGNVV